MLEQGIDPHDAGAVSDALAAAGIDCGFHDGDSYVRLGGVNPEPFLRDTRINAHVSTISTIPAVRAQLTGLLRAFAREGSVVMEGRDIGTAVFPATPYKFYIDASMEVRAQRRQTQEGGGPAHDQIAARDRTDSTRRVAPLTIAEDAHVIDSSRLTIDGVVGEVIGRLKLKGLAVA